MLTKVIPKILTTKQIIKKQYASHKKTCICVQNYAFGSKIKEIISKTINFQRIPQTSVFKNKRPQLFELHLFNYL
ncbi:hypothetical protein FFWV33_05625 [Flavobacterium faecale]|uniref:Uncharacterized protein n=1 Tax=Flavobacterium faecale TaxID=1355330 RepID=A0A2S1LBC4_9FLAO|nr:hypothetical protein FFWV33_05625 [Flavobacterium faecale]